jgi:Type IV secretion-system coupling protein DNA-binding domain
MVNRPTIASRTSGRAIAAPEKRRFRRHIDKTNNEAAMNSFFEQLFAWGWNRMVAKPSHPTNPNSLRLGFEVIDGQITPHPMIIPQVKRAEHMAILGRTGTGKSSLLRFMASQDITCNRGFLFFDLHGDATVTLLRLLALEEQVTRQDLSARIIIIEPADPEFSVGLNVLEPDAGQHSFVQIAEFAAVLKQRWHLDSFGARTEELLRNSLLLLAENRMTLLELAPLLTDEMFRARCLRLAGNSEARDYFATRYNQASEGQQTMFRDAVLNKVSAFTSDPHFRHILGQQRSTFSLIDAIDGGYWIIVNLDKGRLGEHAATLGSLLLTKVKNALFARRRRQLFTLYCDEIQNLVAFDSGLDTLLSEARKFGIGMVSANQFLDQYPPQMRAAIMAIGTHILFQLSSSDADKMAAALDGGKHLAEILKNLPQRNLVVKTGHHHHRRVAVPPFEPATTAYQDLYNRCRTRWARRRGGIEREIRNRIRPDRDGQTREALHGWE